jgi:hypothetical protein
VDARKVPIVFGRVKSFDYTILSPADEEIPLGSHYWRQMLTLAETYRQKGEEASLQAREDSGPFTRQTYEKIADHWHELADRIEQEDKNGGRSPHRREETVDGLIESLAMDRVRRLPRAEPNSNS